ncbi:hypothetical protein PT312_00180 [Metamycoplasma hyosynoviae]|nr:hypothetical protein [Metamycoplasma hyosynoviae]MDD1376703.1 hypothetical protein [Metamycoplasma hyosynoviae]
MNIIIRISNIECNFIFIKYDTRENLKMKNVISEYVQIKVNDVDTTETTNDKGTLTFLEPFSHLIFWYSCVIINIAIVVINANIRKPMYQDLLDLPLK